MIHAAASTVRHGQDQIATNGGSAARDREVIAIRDWRFSRLAQINHYKKDEDGMLDMLGQPVIGHGIIKPISFDVIEAQLAKREFNTAAYNKQILQELRTEQTEFYELMRQVGEGFATGQCQRDTNDWFYWQERFMFIVAFAYKIISVGIESRWLKEDIRL